MTGTQCAAEEPVVARHAIMTRGARAVPRVQRQRASGRGESASLVSDRVKEPDMNNSVSSPQAWDDECDSGFMRITAPPVIPRRSATGASVMLTSYDPDDALTANARSTVQTAPAARGGADRETRRSWIHNHAR
jgi:hypothetical protein